MISRMRVSDRLMNSIWRIGPYPCRGYHQARELGELGEQVRGVADHPPWLVRLQLPGKLAHARVLDRPDRQQAVHEYAVALRGR